MLVLKLSWDISTLYWVIMLVLKLSWDMSTLYWG